MIVLIFELEGGARFGMASTTVPGQKFAPHISPEFLKPVDTLKTFANAMLFNVELLRVATAGPSDESTGTISLTKSLQELLAFFTQ